MQPFIWMFKIKDFKQHFWYLICLSIILYVLCIGLAFIPIPEPFKFLTKGISYLLSTIPGLYIVGYFWNLTEQIINREKDIDANNIYDGKIKETYTITLPELNFIDNIWRGIASIIATILLAIPFAIIMLAGFKQGTLAALPPAFALFIPAFLCMFFPALFWNFAYRGSVVAVWNIRKAIYLVGNYPLKYFVNVFTMVVINIISTAIDYFLSTFALSKANLIIITIVYAIIGLKYLYFIFVNAYLLGTIAPTSEA